MSAYCVGRHIGWRVDCPDIKVPLESALKPEPYDVALRTVTQSASVAAAGVDIAELSLELELPKK